MRPVCEAGVCDLNNVIICTACVYMYILSECMLYVTCFMQLHAIQGVGSYLLRVVFHRQRVTTNSEHTP